MYRVLAERERDWSATILLVEVLCKLLLERFAEPAAVIELLRRAVFAPDKLVGRSLFAAVLVPAAVAPVAAALVPERLLPLVRLALFAFAGSMLLAPYFV